MQVRIETESKYYCIEPEKLIHQCEVLGLKRVKSIVEDDEYFTDLNSNFIKNRTCLRIRKTDHKDMEITFKGKSLKLLGQYSKIENNIQADLLEYENYVSLFSSLGFYSYVNVDKERIIYSYQHKPYECNVMIDKLQEIGGFVEFEIIANNEDYSREEMNEELNRFVKMFHEVSLTEATEPYRDIVANHIYKKYVSNKNKCIYLNIDDILSDLEKDFYKKNTKELKEIFGQRLKWGLYRLSNDQHIQEVVYHYFANKMFDTTELLALFQLLKKFPYDVHYVTKTNKIFFEGLLDKLGLEIPKHIYGDKEVIKGDLKKSIVLDGELKQIIQIILIIINIEG